MAISLIINVKEVDLKKGASLTWGNGLAWLQRV